ncbi:MAG: hypothetical protein NTU60_07465 [Candidatus Aminicenantes bacterium]|nr:hypothetical protein [Candidatus Aminicenantes bacterium]
MVSRSEKYVVPGEASLMITTEYKKDALESSYPRHFFTEILCSKQVEVSEDLSQAFHAKVPSAHGELLRLAEQDAKRLKTATDLIAGTIGLRFHRQFVIEVINENFFAMRTADDYAFNQFGPGLEVLDGISLNSNGAEILHQLLEGVGQATPEAQELGAAALAWLLRAWRERDNISKFTALFIPIEIILAGYGDDPNKEKEKQEEATQIRNLLATHGGSEANDLLAFFNRIMGQQRLSLASRFEEMAKQAQIDGWEADVVAFKRFNSIRNKLLHRGEQQVQLVISVGQNIEEETRQLEDIAERYVSWALFRDGAVYQSRWRPLRNKRQGEKIEQ